MSSVSSSRPLRLLHLVHSLRAEAGGTATAVLQIARRQQALGHQVEIAYLQTLDAPPPPDLTVHEVGGVRGGYGYHPALGSWLKQRVDETDLLILHGLWQYHGLAVWRHWRPHGGRYLVFPHGMLDPWFNRSNRLKQLKKLPYWWTIERRLLRDAAAVCYTCAEEQRLARESFPGYRAHDQVVGLGVAEPSVDPDTARQALADRFPLLRDVPFLLFLGRLHPKKGLTETLSAYAQWCQENPQAPALVVAGPATDSAYRQRLIDHTASLGLEQIDLRSGASHSSSPAPFHGHVLWLPLVQGSLKEGLLRQCEALVLFSHQENFGLVVAEALACGRPVLLSKPVNIWREIVTARAGLAGEDSATGALQLLRSWQAIDLVERNLMAIRARQTYEKHFALHQAVNSLLVLADHARRHPTS